VKKNKPRRDDEKDDDSCDEWNSLCHCAWDLCDDYAAKPKVSRRKNSSAF